MYKKYLILICILTIIAFYTSIEKAHYHKVLKIESPQTLYIDYNKNLIFDETTPININNLYFIERNKDYGNDNILKSLTDEEKIFLEYYAKYHSTLLLKNKFVKLKNNIIYINNKEYKNELLKTGFFYEDTQKSKTALVENLKKYNLNNYVLLNTKSKYYHNLDCIDGIKSKNYKVIKKNLLANNTKPCKSCILQKNSNKRLNNIAEKIYNIQNSFKLDNIEVYFLDLNQILIPSKQCKTLACKSLKNEIKNAKSSIDFAIYGINNQPEIFNELVNAKNRGVRIRWVCDFNKAKENHYPDTIKLQKILQNYNTDKQYDLSNRSAIMHNKFFIFDKKKVFTGSSNITGTGLTGFNSNISLLINNEEIAQIYTNEFEQMYNGYFHTQKRKQKNNAVVINNNTKVKVLFSPQDKIIETEIIPLIENAKEYIYIPIFFITKKELISPLINAKNKGIDVKIINDATNAHSKYTIHKELRRNSIEIKTENYAGKMHTKALIIDDKISVIGSMNFSNNGEKRNDENMIIIENEDITKYLKKTFLYLWTKIPNKYLSFDPKAESLESIGSCFDRIDNDYDGKIDNKDTGCYKK